MRQASYHSSLTSRSYSRKPGSSRVLPSKHLQGPTHPASPPPVWSGLLVTGSPVTPESLNRALSTAARQLSRHRCDQCDA